MFRHYWEYSQQSNLPLTWRDVYSKFGIVSLVRRWLHFGHPNTTLLPIRWRTYTNSLMPFLPRPSVKMKRGKMSSGYFVACFDRHPRQKKCPQIVLHRRLASNLSKPRSHPSHARWLNAWRTVSSLSLTETLFFRGTTFPEEVISNPTRSACCD